MEHPTVQMTFKGSVLDIDEKIAPLIQLLWTHGIDTAYGSCQGNPLGSSDVGVFEPAFITFPSKDDLFKLFQLLDWDIVGLSDHVYEIQLYSAYGFPNRKTISAIRFEHEKIEALTDFVRAKIAQ